MLLSDGDNKLLIDLDNKNSLIILYKHLKNNQYISLVESLFPPDNFLVKDVDGEGYSNELVIPLSKVTNKEKKILTPISFKPVKTVQRKFNLGSEWMYVKIYGGAMLLDVVLKTKIVSLVKILEEDKVINKWFFIRYNDPHYHLRIRFQLAFEKYLGKVIRLLNEILHDEILNKTIYKIQYDAYERELERYGNDMIESCEFNFWRDSACIVNMLNAGKDNNYDKNFRWHFALNSMDEYLNSFKIDMVDRIRFTDMLCDSFCKEFGDVKVLKRDLENLYRSNRNLVENYFKINYEPRVFLGLLEERSKSLSDTTERMLKYYSEQNTIGIHIPILPSIIHMSINRLFPVYQRKYEMILYYFLNRYYKKVFYSN